MCFLTQKLYFFSLFYHILIQFVLIMKRDAYEFLLNWKNNMKDKPLILLGPRCVGKTSLIKKFGKNEFKKMIYINFEDMKEIKELFGGDSLTHEKLLEKTIGLLGVFNSEAENSLFIVEEIQEYPQVIPLMEYVKNNISNFHLIITSSNPGTIIDLNIDYYKEMVIFYELKPLSFKEFLLNTNHNLYSKYKDITLNNNIDKIYHNQLLQEYLNYTIIGGMPEVVSTWKRTKDYSKVDDVQRNVINQIKNDFLKAKHKTDIKKIANLWDNVILQSPKELKKFQFSKLGPNARDRNYNESIKWLNDSRLINILFLTLSNDVPLQNRIKNNTFKIYLNDVGLLKNELKLLNDFILNNKENNLKNAIFENFIYNNLMLEIDKNKMFFFDFRTHELDFLIEYKNNVIPIDVKSSNISEKSSLKNYIKLYKPKLSIQFTSGFLRIEKDIIKIPFYLVNKTFELIDDFFSNQS